MINEELPTERNGNAGFTFVEILAALAFLAILIPTVMSALGISNRAAETAERTTTAAELGENQLNELIIGNAWQSTGNSGDFGAAWPGYRWQVSQDSWTGDANNPMTQLTIHITFPVQGKDREIQISTLVSTSLTQ
jgi:type II secretion system protein I